MTGSARKMSVTMEDPLEKSGKQGKISRRSSIQQMDEDVEGENKG
jgi:hypothetical protein